ncbi:hypothetical protein NL108_016467 [Boleophthalmus pectinirostris]|nr:hypothetical protein NL108_016467 [Boleophthalmus pectinirostris]
MLNQLFVCSLIKIMLELVFSVICVWLSNSPEHYLNPPVPEGSKPNLQVHYEIYREKMHICIHSLCRIRESYFSDTGNCSNNVYVSKHNKHMNKLTSSTAIRTIFHI